MANDSSIQRESSYLHESDDEREVELTMNDSVHSLDDDASSSIGGVPRISLDLSESLVGDYGSSDEDRPREEDSQDDIWLLVEKMCDELTSFSNSDKKPPKILEAPAARLKVLLDMHKKIGEKTNFQQMARVGLLMECKLYLEILRDIENIGKKANWKSPLLQEARAILYQESPEFKLAT